MLNTKKEDCAGILKEASFIADYIKQTAYEYKVE